MAARIAVTGSTGHVGGLVAAALASRGIEQRLVVRPTSAQRAPAVPGAELALAEYGDRSAGTAALVGIDTLLMVSAGESPDRLAQHRTFIDSAAAAGVRRIVYTSFYGASPTCTFTLGRDHWGTEEHIRASGMGFTFLRDNFYLDVLVQFAGPDGVIRGPAGRGRVAGVARADVARAATTVLLAPASQPNATYDLTGPQALTLSEVAEIASRASGRTITFHDESVAEAYASRAHFGVPDWQVAAWVSTYTAIAAGELDQVTGDIAALTGRQPLTLQELLAG